MNRQSHHRCFIMNMYICILPSGYFQVKTFSYALYFVPAGQDPVGEDRQSAPRSGARSSGGASDGGARVEDLDQSAVRGGRCRV